VGDAAGPSPGRFAGRVAIVTGAASGIGWAVARLLRDEGAAVVGLDLRAEAPEGAEARVCDVTDTGQVDAAVADAVASHGRLDVLANVAGVPQFGHTDRLDDEEWQRSLDVNLSGPFKLCRAALPHLRRSRGSIVNVSSVAGLEGQAYTAAYCASKGGLVLFTKALAVELAPEGVRVNCVCPAAVDTPLLGAVAPRIPADADPRLLERLHMLMPGLVTPEQVAAAVAYLASDDAGMVTGQALALDGGRSA
jgi:meso-butanediol dehydrogenase / (S,S)-butanediol dehydrogenase / diacetyl reductase